MRAVIPLVAKKISCSRSCLMIMYSSWIEAARFGVMPEIWVSFSGDSSRT